MESNIGGPLLHAQMPGTSGRDEGLQRLRVFSMKFMKSMASIITWHDRLTARLETVEKAHPAFQRQ